MMLGLVFTFESEPGQEAALGEAHISQWAVDAVSNAIHGDADIHYEEITERSDPRPKIAVIFSDMRQMDGFTARLTLALLPTGIRILNVRAIKEAASSEEDAAA